MKFRTEDYFDKKRSFAYGGKYRVIEAYGGGGKNRIDKELRKNKIYTINKQYKKPRRYTPIYVDRPRQLIESDTAYIKRDRKGYRYILCFIDDYTKFTWLYPLKNIGSAITVKCLDDFIMKNGGKTPEKLYTDRGTEYTGNVMKTYTKNKKIRHILSYSIRKCPTVERFILTIKRILLPMVEKEKLPWSTLLSHAQDIYHRRKHRTIQMSPLDAEKKTNRYKLAQIYEEKYAKAEKNWQKPKYKVGQTVRIYLKKTKVKDKLGTFHRGFKPYFSNEIFRITKVLTNLPVVRYELASRNGAKQVKARFFQDEIIPTTTTRV